MRVLHFYKTFYPDTFGGVEQVIAQFAKGMAPYGVVTDVLTLSKQPNQIHAIDDCTVHRAKLNFQVASTGFSLSAFKMFRELVAQADIVHYHFPWPFMDLVHFSHQIKIPKIVTYHSDIVKQKHLLKLYRPLMMKFLNSVDCIVASSPNYVATSSVLQKFQSKVSIVPMGLNQDLVSEPNESLLNAWRRRLPEKFFLFVGVLRYYKGLHILLNAVRENHFPVVIVGNGPEELALKEQVAHLKLSNVYFLGALEDRDKFALLHLCYAFVFPSHLRSEAFGLSLLEAAMCAKPMISCEIGTGTSYINIHEQTGIVVAPADEVALCAALELLWGNAELARSYGAAAKKRFQEQFTSQLMIDQYLDIYHQLLT